MDNPTTPEEVVQLKQACERLSRSIREGRSHRNDDEYTTLRELNLLDALQNVGKVLQRGCGSQCPSHVLGWSDDFYQCMNLLCFERYAEWLIDRLCVCMYAPEHTYTQSTLLCGTLLYH